MKKLLISLIVLFIIIVAAFTQLNKPTQTVTQANIKPTETYEYIVTSINSEGLTGKSTKDNTGIYLSTDQVKSLHLSVNDTIEVTFPKSDFETITHVQKVTSQSKIIKESFTVTSVSNGQYKATNNRKGTDKDKLTFTQSDVSSNKTLNIGDKVEVYYKPLEGEDQFIKVE
jgi:mannose/fructose/N-acetylgalactosamine-specific phosphotransferase system component IIB